MQVTFYGMSDTGKKRQKNEDTYFAGEKLNFFMVADGMGGHVGGEFASRLAVETVKEVMDQLTDDPEATLQETEIPLKPGDFQGYLRYALNIASRRIYEKSVQDIRLQGMGTTGVALLFRNNRAYVANVGDSRAYRFRKKKLEQLTKDHSLIAEQVRAGILSPEEGKGHRLKNVITRSIGFQGDVDVDTQVFPVEKGDIFLLCSDGLYNLVEDAEILEIVSHHAPKEAARHLIDVANARGGDDNITVILAQIKKTSDLEEEEESTQAL